MFVCPNILLTLSIDTPLLSVRVANVWRPVCINSMQIKIRSSQTFDG